MRRAGALVRGTSGEDGDREPRDSWDAGTTGTPVLLLKRSVLRVVAAQLVRAQSIVPRPDWRRNSLAWLNGLLPKNPL